MRADARPRIRDLLKAREAPLIFTKNEAERSCAGAKSRLLGRAVQVPEDVTRVFAAEGAKELSYMADQKKDLPYTADRKVQSECGAKLGLDEAQDSRRHILKSLNAGAWTRTLEAGVKSGIEYRKERRPAFTANENRPRHSLVRLDEAFVRIRSRVNQLPIGTR